MCFMTVNTLYGFPSCSFCPWLLNPLCSHWNVLCILPTFLPSYVTSQFQLGSYYLPVLHRYRLSTKCIPTAVCLKYILTYFLYVPRLNCLSFMRFYKYGFKWFLFISLSSASNSFIIYFWINIHIDFGFSLNFYFPSFVFSRISGVKKSSQCLF